jgi:hypothetical protein
MITKDIDFSTPIEKAALATTLVASEIIDKLKALDIMDYQDVVDRMKDDNQLDTQATEVIQSLMNGGMDLKGLDVETVFKLLMGKMTGSKEGAGGQAGVGKDNINAPAAPPTLEDMKSAQKKKAEGMKVGGSDFIQRLMNRTKLPSPQTGVTTA